MVMVIRMRSQSQGPSCVLLPWGVLVLKPQTTDLHVLISGTGTSTSGPFAAARTLLARLADTRDGERYRTGLFSKNLPAQTPLGVTQ